MDVLSRLLRLVFGIDLRALAALRIGIATVGLCDLALRARSLGAHYSDAGTLPRVDLLAWFADWHQWPLCVHLAAGSAPAMGLLFIAHAAVLTALLVGWRSRTAAFVAWLLFASLLSRNPFVSYGGDVLLRLMLFWSVLLPIGAVWSVDRALAEDDQPRPQRWLSTATAGFVLQICTVLLIAGAAKATTSAWVTGQGLAFALDQEEMARGLGRWLRGFPSLTSALTYATLGIEMGGAGALLLLPWGPTRMVVVAAVWAMMAGIASTLYVGLFPPLMAIVLLPLLPPWFWDRVEGCRPFERLAATLSRDRVRGVVGRLRGALTLKLPSSPPLPSASAARRLLNASVAALALTFSLVWNWGFFYDANYVAPAPIAWFGFVTQFRQSWGMFSLFSKTGWFAVPGRLKDGREVDLMAAGGPLPSEQTLLHSAVPTVRPAFVPGQYLDIRWQKMFSLMREMPDRNGHFVYYARYLCREWNRNHSGGDALQGLQILYFNRTVGAHPEREPVAADYQKTLLWDHDCFG